MPNYDFNWQTQYVFAQPLRVPKGATLKSVAHYDNSKTNKANPDSTQDVYWGDQTWEEMQYTGIYFSIDKEAHDDRSRAAVEKYAASETRGSKGARMSEWPKSRRQIRNCSSCSSCFAVFDRYWTLRL